MLPADVVVISRSPADIAYIASRTPVYSARIEAIRAAVRVLAARLDPPFEKADKMIRGALRTACTDACLYNGQFGHRILRVQPAGACEYFDFDLEMLKEEMRTP